MYFKNKLYNFVKILNRMLLGNLVKMTYIILIDLTLVILIYDKKLYYSIPELNMAAMEDECNK